MASILDPRSTNIPWVAAFAGLLSIAATSTSQACSDDLIRAAGNRNRTLLIQTSDGWKPVGATTGVERTFPRLAYVGRRVSPSTNREGALTVMFYQLRVANEKKADIVKMRRPTARSTCGLRGWRPNFLGLDFVTGQQERVETYVQHHAGTLDRSSTITDYHITYRSPEDGCVSTESTIGNRRTGFLSTDDEAEDTVGDAVASFWRGWGSTPVNAAEARDETRKRRYVARVKLELEAFSTASGLESQIYTYPLSQRACAVFDMPSGLSLRPGSEWRIDVIDLDDRTKGRRTTFPVKWQ